MYQCRLKLKPKQSFFYLITNYITGGEMIFEDPEKKFLRDLLFASEKRHASKIWDFIILGNHYHVIMEIPAAHQMSRADVLQRWQDSVSLCNPKDPGDKVLAEYRKNYESKGRPQPD